MKNELNLSGVSTATIVRGIMTVIAAVNIAFGYLGYHLIPVTDADVAGMVDGLIVAITAFIWGWGWWKNNSFTVNAQTADDLLRQLKEEN